MSLGRHTGLPLHELHDPPNQMRTQHPHREGGQALPQPDRKLELRAFLIQLRDVSALWQIIPIRQRNLSRLPLELERFITRTVEASPHVADFDSFLNVMLKDVPVQTFARVV